MDRILQRIKAIILDMDGVIYRGNQPIEGAARAVAFLRGLGKKVIFLTNNSENSRSFYVQKLRQMGIPVGENDVITSGQVAADFIKRRDPQAKVFVIGGRGLVEEIAQAELEIVSPERANYVVVGIDQALTYEKLKDGLQALLSGARFIATNPDRVYPTEHGFLPGAGAIVAALERSSGRKPDVIIGKPSPHMVSYVLKKFGLKPSTTAIIGDQIETDIKAGKRAGLLTILVLSGVATEVDVKKVRGTKNAPDCVLGSLAEVVL
ncbi:MAG: HAD-IIA family hydrolase [Candidatus Hadarchaeum sp.]|uniref:HAD-IIA family hydrolase n=1 Tax=Candidatus Hadarchaeum sp. TaxID=2883567 RepID=UPI003D0FF113